MLEVLYYTSRQTL